MAPKKQRFMQPKTQPGPLGAPLSVKVIFDHPEESPVPFADVASVQGTAGVILITFGRVVIPFDLTSQEITERAARQGVHATVVARVALPLQAASALTNILVELSKQIQLQVETQRVASAAQSDASIQSSESSEEQK